MEPDTCPYPELHQSSPCPPSQFLKIHFNIILPSTPGSTKWSPTLRSTQQNPVYISPLTRTNTLQYQQKLDCGYPVDEHSGDSLFTLWTPLVTICITSGHRMYRQLSLHVTPVVNISTISLTFSSSTFCAHSVSGVLCGSENKQRLFPYTSLTDWFV